MTNRITPVIIAIFTISKLNIFDLLFIFSNSMGVVFLSENILCFGFYFIVFEIINPAIVVCTKPVNAQEMTIIRVIGKVE